MISTIRIPFGDQPASMYLEFPATPILNQGRSPTCPWANDLPALVPALSRLEPSPSAAMSQHPFASEQVTPRAYLVIYYWSHPEVVWLPRSWPIARLVCEPLGDANPQPHYPAPNSNLCPFIPSHQCPTSTGFFWVRLRPGCRRSPWATERENNEHRTKVFHPPGMIRGIQDLIRSRVLPFPPKRLNSPSKMNN